MVTQNNNPRKDLAISRGKRLKTIRLSLNLTRKALQQSYNFNSNTIQAWEKGANCLNEDNAKKLVAALNHAGANIKLEWLLHGTNLTNNTQQPIVHDISSSLANVSNDIKILEEISYFRSNNNNPLVAMVIDDSLLPVFANGDYVGGIAVSDVQDIKLLIGEFCIININEVDLIVRKIVKHQTNNDFIVSSINYMQSKDSPQHLSCQIFRAAKITRHWIPTQDIVSK